jgi:arylsulfatase A-like enzyme
MTLSYDLKLWPNLLRPDEPLLNAVNNFRERMTDDQRAAWDAVYAPVADQFHADPPEGRDLVRWKYQRYMQDYLASIRSVDDNLGRVLAHLESRGLSDNTIVVYSSDQGFYLGEHGWFDKRWMYEESFRTPLIVRWPGVTGTGTRNRQLVQNLDFAQTFLDMAGVTAPESMQGRSLVPLLRGEAVTWRDALYYHYYEFPGVHAVPRHYGVRTDRYKLIHYYQLDEWELFDLQTDPQELQSVHADPAYADVRAQLARRLEELRSQYAVPADLRGGGS